MGLSLGNCVMDGLGLENESLSLSEGEKVGLNIIRELGLEKVNVGSAEGVLLGLGVACELGLEAVTIIDGDVVGCADETIVGLVEGAHVG